MYTSRLAALAGVLAVLAALLFALPPLAIQLGLLQPFVGFRIFLLGGLLGLLALALGVAGLFRTRPATGRGGRGRAWLATLVGAVIVGVIGAAAGPGAHLPPINDITTDLDDPPRFVTAAELPANRGADMSYPGAVLAAQQRVGYPDLGPIRVAHPPAEAFAETLQAVKDLGWEVHDADPDAGRIEATDTSSVFRFVDDIVVRIRPGGSGEHSGSRVDVRSRSRVGKGDLGANAARIRRLADALSG